MNLDRSSSNTDEYFVTALHIFNYCGGDSTGTLRVDALMDKFAPFVKTNKAEFSFLKSMLDPEQCNPDIDVSQLADALHQYSESQKTKVDLDESFNLKSGQVPQDSDSGISTDGFQLVEELQCSLREKSHLAQQLRSQLDFTDRQHEEAIVALTAERDALRAHLNLLREENMTLCHVRRDYDEACERLCAREQQLQDARLQVDANKRRTRALNDEIAALETEKSTLQELLSRSKDECHRINEMYASRQSALIEQNETLHAERADLAARMQDQEDFLQQIIKEKLLLEMELKDAVNKSNQTQFRLDRSIDVSYTEDQMLTALDTLTINNDTRFVPENRILDENSFEKALEFDQGRTTNVSLFDEMRYSFCSISKVNITDLEAKSEAFLDNLENSFNTIGTQTDDGFNECCSIKSVSSSKSVQCIDNTTQTINTTPAYSERESQTDRTILENFQRDVAIQTIEYLTKLYKNMSTQTEDKYTNILANPTFCYECSKNKVYIAKLESDLKSSQDTVKDLELDLDGYGENLNLLQNFLDEGNEKNNILQTVVNSMQNKLNILEAACADQKDRIDLMSSDTCCAEIQTDSDLATVSTQAEVPCVDCEKRNAGPHRSIRKYLWEPLKCLFQVFAVICFLCAVSVLYGVTRRWNARCVRDSPTVPWRWFDAQDIMDLLLRIEYVADVPM